MAKNHPQTPESRAYFNGFAGNLGSRQLPKHLMSHPQWWTLRDSNGRNPLMHAVYAKGATSEILEWPHIRPLTRAVDNRGCNLFFHLVRAMKFGNVSSRETTEAATTWIRPLNKLGVMPAVTRGGWGLVAQHILERPTHNWCGFLLGLGTMIEVARGRGTNLKLCGQSHWQEADAALWWSCSEVASDTVAHWMNEVRALDDSGIRRLGRLAEHTLLPAQRAALPASLRGALLLNDMGAGVFTETIERELADGVHFSVSDARRAKFIARLGAPGRAFFASAMARVDASRLRETLPPAPVVETRRQRL